MNKTLAFVAAAALVMFAAHAKADAIPYPNTGTVAPSNTFTATATGDVTGYFVQGGSASGGGAVDSDEVELIDLTHPLTSGFYFPNQTTLAGTSQDFGAVTAGDTLEFVIEDLSSGYTYYSTGGNPDGVNHTYSTTWAGGTLNGASIPAGTYVGMEDSYYTGAGDPKFNYNDDSFVFTDVSSTPTPAVPEPGSLYLLGTGLLGLGLLLRRRAVRA